MPKHAKKSFLKKLKNILGTSKKSTWTDLFPESCYQSYYFNTPGKPVWMPREYKRFADEAYIRNVVCYRSISMIAQSAAHVPWRLFHVADEHKRELKNHPLLRLLANPNPADNGKELFESIYAYKMISGNSFILAITPNNEEPTELYALRPDRVSVIAGKDGMPSAYQYEVGKTAERYPVDRITGLSNVLHLKNFHPLNDWYGLSQIEPSAYAVDQHNQASVWNQALLQNGARPTGALVVKSGPDGSSVGLSEEQYLRIRSQMDEQFSGAANAGRPLLLEGGLDWKEMSMSPKDMDFLNTKHSSAREIALAFGVPPQLLGIPGDNTYSNLVEARIALWEQTIIPLVDNVTTALNSWLVPRFGPDLELTYNIDEIPALAPKRENKWKQIDSATFMTINEKRQAMGLPAIPDGDVIAQ